MAHKTKKVIRHGNSSSVIPINQEEHGICIVMRNPDNLYLKNLKDVDVRFRHDGDMIKYETDTEKWESALYEKSPNAIIIYPNMDAGEY